MRCNTGRYAIFIACAIFFISLVYVANERDHNIVDSAAFGIHVQAGQNKEEPSVAAQKTILEATANEPGSANKQASTAKPTAANSDNAAEQDLIENDFGPAWIPVPGKKAIVFSAYFDPRANQPNELIRVLVSMDPKEPTNLFCRLVVNSSFAVIVDAHSRLIAGHMRTRYDAYWFTCLLTSQIGQPVGVQMLPTAFPSASELKSMPLVQIGYNLLNRFSDIQSVSKVPLAFCVGRSWQFKEWLQLLLFMEFYIAQGVSKFLFYHRSWTKEVDRLIASYERDGLVEIIPFPKPPKLLHGTEDPYHLDGVWDQDQIINTNDCVYYAMNKAEHVFVADVDEFIVFGDGTKTDKTLLQFLQRKQTERGGNIGEFSFRNRVVQAQWPRVETTKLDASIANNLPDLLKPFFSANLVNNHSCPHYYYQKCIVKPETVVSYLVHSAGERTGRSESLSVDISEATKFHLKAYETGGQPDLKFVPGITDYHPCRGLAYTEKPSPFRNFETAILPKMQSRIQTVVSSDIPH